MGIWPSNADEKVEKFLYAFNLNAETIFDLEPMDPTVKIPFPTPTTIGTAIIYYMETTVPISRQSFSTLIQFAATDKIEERLYKLAEDKKRFSDEITSKIFDLADSVLYLSSCAKWETVPWEVLVELLAHLQPCYYSISSSPLSERKTIHISSVVESFPNPMREGKVVGVATNLLKHIQVAQNNDTTKDLEAHFNFKGPVTYFQALNCQSMYAVLLSNYRQIHKHQ